MRFLVALVAAFSIGHAYRTLPAALAPAIAAELALEPWALGVLGGAFNVVFAAMQLPIGVALDRVEVSRDAQRLVAHGVHVLVLGRVPLGGVVGVQDLQGDEPPADVIVTLRAHLFDPTRRDPGPRTHRIEEELEIGHQVLTMSLSS